MVLRFMGGLFGFFFYRRGNDFCSDCIGEKGIISNLGIMSVFIQSFSAVINFIFYNRSCITSSLGCHQIHETFDLMPFSR